MSTAVVLLVALFFWLFGLVISSLKEHPGSRTRLSLSFMSAAVAAAATLYLLYAQPHWFLILLSVTAVLVSLFFGIDPGPDRGTDREVGDG